MIFQNSLGIDFGDNRIYVVYLQASFSGVQLRSSTLYHMDGTKTLHENVVQSAELINVFIRENHISNANLYLSIPRKYAIVRNIEFPMAVKENLEMGSFLKGPKALRRESMDLVMTLFPILRERTGQAAGTLSGGEQQMLAIARGLMSKPKLLILDEPSLGLAPILVEEIFNVVRRIRSEGVTILLVEQNVPQALSISDRAYVLEEGSVGLSGTGKELLQNPHIKKLYLGL